MASSIKKSRVDSLTKEDWDVVMDCRYDLVRQLPDQLIEQLKLLEADKGGFPVDRLEHCLQTATRAYRNNESEEYVVGALLHDIGDVLCPLNHAEVAAAIVRPFVSEKIYWIIRRHNVFQGAYYFQHIGFDPEMKEKYRDNEYFEATERFCELYDNPAFDVDYDSMSLEEFRPMLVNIFKPKSEK